ncbi:MAG: phosphatidylglycerophosphatase A [Sterolibacterium sp.]
MKRSPPPPWRFLFSHPAHFIACGLGSGLSPVASGTVGTLLAWALYPLLRPQFGGGDSGFAAFLLLAFAYGVSACGRTGRDLGVVDHGAIVWDEIVPFWAVLFMTPPGGWWQLGAFLLFRFFDIVKPPPADWFDAKVKNGFGVMMDDVVAAVYTVLTLAVIKVLIG